MVFIAAEPSDRQGTGVPTTETSLMQEVRASKLLATAITHRTDLLLKGVKKTDLYILADSSHAQHIKNDAGY